MLVRVLGPFEVEGDDGPVILSGGAQRAVLALLALRAGGPVGVPELVDALWPEDPPPSARNSMQSHVARLRARLGVPGIITLEPAGYRLNLPRTCVDALRFEDLVRDHRAPAEAMGLWRGRPLPEFPDEPFRGAAARLVRLHRIALLRHAASLPAADAAAELHTTVDADPCWEEGAVTLAAALTAAGRRGEALEVLRHHADAVVDRLGLDPSERVRRAQVALLRGEPADFPPAADRPRGVASVDASSSGVAKEAHGPVTHGPVTRGTTGPGTAASAGVGSGGGRGWREGAPGVPLRFSSFLGREGEQRQLAALLAEPGLVSVVGPGGVGKTRLVAETVRAAPRVAWVDAADVREADFLAAVAVAVGARVAPHEVPVAVIAAAAERYPVVVLDNCEHVLSAAAEVAEALRGVRVVVTSQESLRVDGEQVLRLGPLAPETARRLFCERARVPMSPAVGEVVERLDSLPLAIELAATQAAVLGVEELHARLDDRLDLLSRGRRGGDPRHRTLRAVVAWSFGLLDPASERLLRRLAVFAGGFSVAAAEAVAADGRLPRPRVAGLLAGLVDRSLVARHGVGRFRLLETVRAYASEPERAFASEPVAEIDHAVDPDRAMPNGDGRVMPNGSGGPRAASGWPGGDLVERAAARAGGNGQRSHRETSRRESRRRAGRADAAAGPAPGPNAVAGRGSGAVSGEAADRAETEARHAMAMAAMAEELDSRMRGPEQASAVREIDAILPDLRLAHARGSADIRVRLAAAMYRYGYRCQQYEVLAWGLAAVDGPRHPDALAAAATHAWGRGDLAEARKLAGLADPPGAPAHEVLGDVALVACDARTAIAHYRAMDGEPIARVSGLVGEALVRAWSGQVERAVELAVSAVELADSTGNPSARAEARYGLGEALGDTDPERALELLDEAVALAGPVDDRLFQAAAGTAAVAVRSRHGDPGPALAAFRDVLRLWRRAGNDTLHAAALRNLIVLLVRVGEDETAVLIDAALPPAAVYPAEAARLDRARAAAEERLGAERVAALRRRGALLGPAQIAGGAARTIDAALARGRD
ncbi:BTAD domain-containing putative transcriptional regulator [Actinoplanes sp. GCM10030250]|uniref:AfsR/SARP family transcriptional regulator n=1 Tax=Actinoplanes sp. GCM10030250 TaxID=3273376 RepID=UPI003612BF7B